MLSFIFRSIENSFDAFNKILQDRGWDNEWGAAGMLFFLCFSQIIYYLLRRNFLTNRGLSLQFLCALFFRLTFSFGFIWLFMYSIRVLSMRFGFSYVTDQVLNIAISLAIGFLLAHLIDIVKGYFLERHEKNTKVLKQLVRSIKSLKILIYTATLWTMLMSLKVITGTLFLSGLSLFFCIFLLYNLRIYHDLLLEVLLRKNYLVAYTFVRALYPPLRMMVRVEVTYLTFVILAIQRIHIKIIHFVTQLNTIFLLFLMLWFFVQLIQLFEEQLISGRFRKKRFDKNMIQVTGRLLRICSFVIFFLCILPFLGVPVSALAGLSGASALVIGIAVQPILANYFGGILIYSDRFFQEGDWIYSPDKSLEGTVEAIGWRSTLIRTFDKRPLYVPNGAFSSISVINASRMRNRRIKETIGIRYTDATALGEVTTQIRTMLQEHPEIDQKQTLLVHFTEFGPSSLNINVYTFTKTCDWKKYRDVQQDVFLKIIDIIKKNGAQLALPGRDVVIDKASYDNFDKKA